MATQTHVILRESLLIPGETFDTAKLQATEERLQNIGYFESVNVYAVRTEEEQFGENYRDIYIEVKETKTGHASLFVGFVGYYDPYDKPGQAELIVAKNRHGAIGNINLTYRKELAQFVNYSPLQIDSDLSDNAEAFAAFTPN